MVKFFCVSLFPNSNKTVWKHIHTAIWENCQKIKNQKLLKIEHSQKLLFIEHLGGFCASGTFSGSLARSITRTKEVIIYILNISLNISVDGRFGSREIDFFGYRGSKP